MQHVPVRPAITLGPDPGCPGDLGETYEAVYRLIRRGGHMPYEGRWITGETPAPALAGTARAT